MSIATIDRPRPGRWRLAWRLFGSPSRGGGTQPSMPVYGRFQCQFRWPVILPVSRPFTPGKRGLILRSTPCRQRGRRVSSGLRRGTVQRTPIQRARCRSNEHDADPAGHRRRVTVKPTLDSVQPTDSTVEGHPTNDHGQKPDCNSCERRTLTGCACSQKRYQRRPAGRRLACCACKMVSVR
jgi:hypothetical protein